MVPSKTATSLICQDQTDEDLDFLFAMAIALSHSTAIFLTQFPEGKRRKPKHRLPLNPMQVYAIIRGLQCHAIHANTLNPKSSAQSLVMIDLSAITPNRFVTPTRSVPSLSVLDSKFRASTASLSPTTSLSWAHVGACSPLSFRPNPHHSYCGK